MRESARKGTIATVTGRQMVRRRLTARAVRQSALNLRSHSLIVILLDLCYYGINKNTRTETKIKSDCQTIA